MAILDFEENNKNYVEFKEQGSAIKSTFQENEEQKTTFEENSIDLTAEFENIKEIDVEFEEKSQSIEANFGEVSEIVVGGTNDHSKLDNRYSANQHPISAITGLEKELEDIKQSVGNVEQVDASKVVFTTSGFYPKLALPLDKRNFFTSLASAKIAASTAQEVGSTSTVYFYGMPIYVVEDGVAKEYIIQPSKTLIETGKLSSIDESQFLKISQVGNNLEIDANGKLNVLTAENAEGDNSRPITSRATYTIVGNINALLETI